MASLVQRLRRLTAASRSRSSVVVNAAIVAVAFAVSRVLGLLREIVGAARFGTGATYDAYVAAYGP